MKREWFSILIVGGLLGLLVLLAALQYRWLGQISEAERDQLQKRLQTDTEHFTQDFNKTIQEAYFSFQIHADDWPDDFTARYQNWRKNSAQPDLIKGFYYIPREGETIRFEPGANQFVPADFDGSFDQIQANFEPIDGRRLILRMPIYEQSVETLGTKMLTTHVLKGLPVTGSEDATLPPRLRFPEISGYLLLELDANTLKNKILPGLTNKYFPGGDYQVSILQTADNSTIFQTQAVKTADISVSFFKLAPDNFAVFVNQTLQSSLKNSQTQSTTIQNQKMEGRIFQFPGQNPNSNITFTIGRNGTQQIFRSTATKNDGIWLLNVQHSAGSLENFVASARHKNLAVSFGILFLLGASVVLIFISTQRAKLLAQRQMEFVSAVSHEFRTPLAVIYSAGENLTDGIVRNENQVAQYGSLIKREGKKLTAMVEQILEFAGARSGRKKYDLREIEIRDVIENALAECQPLLEQKGFQVEREIADNLPKIVADKIALSHAVQNLIINAVKYGDDHRWLKVSARNGGGNVKISVVDHGIGIAPRDVSKIFSPFYRAKAVVDAQIHGNGLGLSLVKQTIEAHGGQVTVKSELEKGSEFTIHLPLNG